MLLFPNMFGPEKNRQNSIYEGFWVSGIEQLAAQVRTSKDINNMVSYLQNSRYQRIVKDSQLLLTPDALFRSGALERAVRFERVKAEGLPSALLHEPLVDYSGTITDIKAELIPPDRLKVRNGDHFDVGLPVRCFDSATITAFEVRGTLTTLGGQKEGEMLASYALYLNPPDFDPFDPSLRKATKLLVQQAILLHSREEITNNRLLWLFCKVRNSLDVKQIVEKSKQKLEGSIETGTSIERRGRLHPFQGGLPGLGENS